MFSEQERAIFGPYYDGHGEKYADPLAVLRRLTVALDGDPAPLVARFHDDLQAQERVLEAAREALGMLPFEPLSGGGATDANVEAVLRAFLEYVEGNGQRGGNSQTPLSPTPALLPSSSQPASVTFPSSS